MSTKLSQIVKLYKSRKQIRNSLNHILADAEMTNKLRAYNMKSLPIITIKDLLNFYDCNISTQDVTIRSDFSTGISPVNDYYVLCCLARSKRIQNYFEIGTWIGLSAYNISSNLGDDINIYTLDLPKGHPDLKLHEIPYGILGHYSKDKPNIHFLKGDSRKFDFSEYYNKFDMVFIDGNHSYEYVRNDTEIALKLLRDSSSVIAWHDYLVLGEINKNVFAGILEGLPQNEHGSLYNIHQSNLAVYSKAFKFAEKRIGKWDISEKTFELTIKYQE